ncbi:MAG: ABC transporter permease [Acidobacteria bacterium]|nr:MAG: ABC transporter permease [Acidobacteriota bacterium]
MSRIFVLRSSFFLADLRFGIRLLRKSPVTSAAAILSLALGIGGTTTIFSAVDAVLLRPLPYAEPERLVLVSATSPMSSGASSTRRGGDLSPADFLDYRSSASFEGLAAISTNAVRLTGDGAPEQAVAAQVSGNFFSLLGVNAIVGRTFLPADDEPGQPAQAVLSESLWQRRYGGSPDLVGRAITVSDQLVEVVGIVPGDFRFEQPVDLWLLGDRGLPRFTSIQNLPQNRDVHILTVVGRLRHGVSMPEAQAELDVISARLAREYPGTNKGWGTALDPLQSALVGHTKRMLMLLFAAVALMLLIASVNVANLVLVRTKARSLELAMRSALGASPARVLRQILAESAVLAACGGVLGLILAAWGVNVLVRLAPEGLPRLEEIAVNGRIAAFALAATGAVALGFGLWPAWRASRAPLNSAIQGSVRSTANHERRRSQLLLVWGELAIAQVLLVAAGLLLASFARLTSLNPGFNPADLVAVDVSLPGAKYRDAETRIRFHEQVLERVSATPGVRSVAMAMQAPMRPTITRGVWIEGQAALAPGEANLTSFLTVSEQYFDTAGVRLLRGRGITRDDTLRSPDVVVVNEAFARRYFSGQDPIGKRIGYGNRTDEHYWRTIVGLAADTREQLGQAARPTTYAPFRQGLDPFTFSAYLVKSSLPVATLGRALQAAVMAADPDQPVSRLRRVEDDMRATIATERFTMLISSMFAGLALLVAAVGTFGVMSHVVRGRTREAGVRMALGATRQSILRLMLGEAAGIALAATVVGLGMAAALGPSIQALLYEVRPRDPSTMAIAAATLVAVAILASYIPIRRMLAQNPLRALKAE